MFYYKLETCKSIILNIDGIFTNWLYIFYKEDVNIGKISFNKISDKIQ